MKRKFFLSIATACMALVMISCGKVPQAEIDSANAAIAEAQTAEAETYVPEEYTALQDSLRIALENIESQKSKLIKKYDAAKQQLIAVTAFATTVKENSANRKVAVQEEIKTGLTEIATILEENKALLKKAPRGKEGAAALEAIKSDITNIETSLSETNTLVESGDIMGAYYKVKAAKEKDLAINNELKTAIEKSKGGR